MYNIYPLILSGINIEIISGRAESAFFPHAVLILTFDGFCSVGLTVGGVIII